jgi:hypothetical protein
VPEVAPFQAKLGFEWIYQSVETDKSIKPVKYLVLGGQRSTKWSQ